MSKAKDITPGGDREDVVDGPYDPEEVGVLHPQSMDHPHADDPKVETKTESVTSPGLKLGGEKAR